MAITVVFAGFHGSTGFFETLGKPKATQAITRLIRWMGSVGESRGGRVIKHLEEGVLIGFKDNAQAIEVGTELQGLHRDRIRNWPEPLKMRLKIGMARGDIVHQLGEWNGDAIDDASRLSNIAAPDQILVMDTVIYTLPVDTRMRYRSLGAMVLRELAEACVVYRIDWQPEAVSELATLPADLSLIKAVPTRLCSTIELAWLDVCSTFDVAKKPVYLGRDSALEFTVQDLRVSRKHARIDWRAGQLYLEDVSSYGTWVRFSGSSAVLALHRQGCALLGEGEIAMGAPFEDFSVPTISFRFSNAVSPLLR